MKKFFVILCTVTLVFGGISAANALTVTSLVGDKDGFGVGINPGDSFGFYPALAQGGGDPAFTDTWVHGAQTWTHTYDLGGLHVTSASLEIFTLGQGWGGASEVWVDGNFVTTLTDGDSSPFPGFLDTNYAVLDVIDLSPVISSLDGADTLTIVTYVNGPVEFDRWAVDYSELTVEAIVPEPSTILLFGVGLVGLFTLGRKKLSKK